MNAPWKRRKNMVNRRVTKERQQRPRKSNEEYMAEYLADREDYEMPCGTWITIPAGTTIEPDEICPFS